MSFVHCILHSYESNANGQRLEVYAQGTSLWVTHELKAKPMTNQEKKPQTKARLKKARWADGELMTSAELRALGRDKIVREFFLE